MVIPRKHVFLIIPTHKSYRYGLWTGYTSTSWNPHRIERGIPNFNISFLIECLRVLSTNPRRRFTALDLPNYNIYIFCLHIYTYTIAICCPKTREGGSVVYVGQWWGGTINSCKTHVETGILNINQSSRHCLVLSVKKTHLYICIHSYVYIYIDNSLCVGV